MPRPHLIAICLAFLGAYGVLYAIHSGRTASNQVVELESQIMEVDSKINDLESEVNNIESEVESVKTTMQELESRRGFIQ